MEVTISGTAPPKKYNLGGECVEFIDKDGYLRTKRGKVKLVSGKNAINYVKRNPRTAIAIGTTAALGTGGAIYGIRSKKSKGDMKKEKTFSNYTHYKYKQKHFMQEGITATEITDYAKANNIASKKEAYSQLLTKKTAARQQAEQARLLERNANKAAGTDMFKQASKLNGKEGVNLVKQTAQKSYNAGLNTGLNQSKSSVGIVGGVKNTWANTGKLGKAGMVGAGVTGAYMLGKGLGLWGNKNKQQ